jgi:predicted kinase
MEVVKHLDLNKGNLIILRGPSGCGKSTLAHRIKNEIDSIEFGPETVICEADEYFYRPDGTYDFNFKLLHHAHEFCFNKFCAALNSGANVIISNTNTRLWEFEKYLDKAKEAGYKITVLRLTKNYGNVHGVPEDKVKQMKDRIEPYEGEVLI